MKNHCVLKVSEHMYLNFVERLSSNTCTYTSVERLCHLHVLSTAFSWWPLS